MREVIDKEGLKEVKLGEEVCIIGESGNSEGIYAGLEDITLNYPKKIIKDCPVVIRFSEGDGRFMRILTRLDFDNYSHLKKDGPCLLNGNFDCESEEYQKLMRKIGGIIK